MLHQQFEYAGSEMTNLKDVAIPVEHHELLRTQHLAMLTTMRVDGLFSTNPVGFVFDGERIRISTLKSRVKYKNIKHDSRVAFCVQSFSNPMYYVELRGHATLETDADRSYFRAQYMSGSGGEEPPEDLDPPGAVRVVITLYPSTVSAPTLYGGRFHKKDDDGSA
jgi:PPOX class probable F420-dependent enzyme